MTNIIYCYRQGMTLGKESGIAKPIEVEMKAGRGGIGLDSQEKRLREEELEQELAKRPKIDPVQFREQLSAQKREAKLHRWAAAAGKLCEKLDKDQVRSLLCMCTTAVFIYDLF